MTSGQIVGKMDTQKQLNVPLQVAGVVHAPGAEAAGVVEHWLRFAGPR